MVATFVNVTEILKVLVLLTKTLIRLRLGEYC